MLKTLLLIAFVVLANGASLTSNEDSYPSSTPEADKLFPAGVFTSVEFSGAPSTCTGLDSCAAVASYDFSDGSLASPNGTINNVPAAAGASCDQAVGCPSVVSTTGPSKAILIGPGNSLQINVPAGTSGVGFLAGVSVASTLTVSANNALTSVTRSMSVTGSATTKLFFGTPAPYTETFSQLTISSDVTTWLVMDDLFYGQIGYFCLGYESVHGCALQVNLVNLPENGVTAQILGDATSNFGSLANGYPILEDVGNRELLICVSENSEPMVDVSEGSVQFLSEVNGRPDCSTNGPHRCYLDPRATMQVPVDCWPQQDFEDHSDGPYRARIALWKSRSTGIAPELSDNFPFRIIDPTIGGYTPLPVYSVLAVPGVFSSVSWFNVRDGVDVLNVLDAPTSTVYDCSKNATTPATSVLSQGVCKSFAVGPDQWLRLTRTLNIRGKCSDAGAPPMVTEMDLVITAPINSLQPQYPITYLYTGVGNEDTAVCVIAAGLYSVVATEGPVSTFPLTSDCSVGRSTQCNGTPLDVVSIIETTGCPRDRACGSLTLSPPYPTVGGRASDGFYPTSLSHIDTTFRNVFIDPNADVSFCVLNLYEVDVKVDVITPSVATSITGKFDCTVGSQSPGVCLRLDHGGAALSLFSVMNVPLSNMPANAVNFLVNLVISDGTTTSVGALPARPAGLNQGDSFCQRGAADYQICVPAIGSDRLQSTCGASYAPEILVVEAEECGSNTNTITCNQKRSIESRDTGDCITTSVDVDCRGACTANIVQELCVWDLLYLPEYSSDQEGVVVELYPLRNQNSPIRAPWTHQGGMPRSYWVLNGMLKVRIVDNPAASLVPIGAGSPNAPSVFSDSGINCTFASECTYNDFLSVIDVSGELTVPASPVVPEESSNVVCSGITYQDNFSNLNFRQPINGATASLSVAGRQFRAPSPLVGCSGVVDCLPEKTVVLRTNLNNYTVNYSWAGLSKVVEDIACVSKDCQPLPCVVRWAPLDQECPDLHSHTHVDQTGILQYDDQDHQHKYKHWRPEPTSGTGLSVNGVTLCQETIGSNTVATMTSNNLACSVDHSRTIQFERYFVLAPDAGAAPIGVDITVGCTSVTHELVCGATVAETGLKFTIPGSELPNPCTTDVNHYWHRCEWSSLESLKGDAQYWPEVSATGQPSLITLATCAPTPNNPYTAWTPLRPFITVSIDLRILPDGSQALTPAHKVDTGDTDLDSSVSMQHGYRGDAYRPHDGSNPTPTTPADGRRNPFDMKLCCDMCSKKRSLLEQAKETADTLRVHTKRDGACPTPPVTPRSCSNPWLRTEVGGFDNLVCVLAGGQYQYKVQELFRNENEELFAPEPETCPVSASHLEWRARIEGCRPTSCHSPAPTFVPVRYTSAEYFSYNVNKSVTPLLPEFLATELTYSSNFVCRRGVDQAYWQRHTLLRPNRLLGPAEDDIPYLRDQPFELASNDRNLVSHSDSFSCTLSPHCSPSPVEITGQALKRVQPKE